MNQKVRKDLQNPDFYRMTPRDRISRLKKLDPNIVYLSDEDQMTLVTRGQEQYGKRPSKAQKPLKRVPGSVPQDLVTPDPQEKYLAQMGLQSEPGLSPTAFEPVVDIVTGLVTGPLVAGRTAIRGGKLALPALKKAFRPAVMGELPGMAGGAIIETEHPKTGFALSLAGGQLDPITKQPRKLSPAQLESKALIEKHRMRGASPAAISRTGKFEKTKLEDAETLTTVTDFLPGGRFANTLRRNQLQKQMKRMHEELYGMIPENKRVQAGEAADLYKTVAYPKAKDSFETQKKAKYRSWERAFPDSEKAIPTPALSTKMNEILESDDVPNSIKSWVNKYFGIKEWTPKVLNSLQGSIWRKASQGGPGAYPDNKGVVGPLFDALKEDLKAYDIVNGTHTFKMYDRAHKYSKLGHQLDKLHEQVDYPWLASNPDRLIDTLFNSGNVDRINILKQHLDKDTWETLKFRFLENMFDKAMKPDKNNVNRFYPELFSNAFFKNEKQLQNIMDPDQFEAIKETAKVFRISAEDVAKAETGFSALQAGVGQTVVSGIASLLGVPYETAIALPNIASYFLAESLMNPKGWMRNIVSRDIEKAFGIPSPQHLRFPVSDTEKDMEIPSVAPSLRLQAPAPLAPMLKLPGRRSMI